VPSADFLPIRLLSSVVILAIQANTSRAPFDEVPLYFAADKSPGGRPVDDGDGYIGGGTKIVKYPFALSVFGHENNPGSAGRAWRSNDGWFPSDFEASL